jgi:hypothetical protein
MEKFISLAGLFLVGYLLGRIISATILLARQKKSVEKPDYNKLSKLIHLVQEEQHGNMLYWFDKIDSQFLAQGRDRNEILEIIKLRYPRHFFCIDQEDVFISEITNWQPQAIKKTVS